MQVLNERQLPKGTISHTSHQPYLDAIAYELNNCPRAPSATAPQQKHSTNSLLPPIDTAVLFAFEGVGVLGGVGRVVAG